METQLREDIQHLGTNLRQDYQTLGEKIDNLGDKIDNKIDNLGDKIDNKIDNLGDKIDTMGNTIGQIIRDENKINRDEIKPLRTRLEDVEDKTNHLAGKIIAGGVAIVTLGAIIQTVIKMP